MNRNTQIGLIMRRRPNATARIKGSAKYPNIEGTLSLYSLPGETLVVAEVSGLPKETAPCSQPIFALHIHSGSSCSGNDTDPFANAGTHYNPRECPHPYHAGDLPPLFSHDGNAFLAVTTNRFTIKEVLGKAVIIHSRADDFTTQPSGNAGDKIACGIIARN